MLPAAQLDGRRGGGGEAEADEDDEEIEDEEGERTEHAEIREVGVPEGVPRPHRDRRDRRLAGEHRRARVSRRNIKTREAGKKRDVGGKSDESDDYIQRRSVMTLQIVFNWELSGCGVSDVFELLSSNMF